MNRIVSFVMMFIMVFTMLPYNVMSVYAMDFDDDTKLVTADENDDVIANGTCGTSANWSLSQDGVLTISGVGAVKYSSISGSDTFFPWSDYNDEIAVAVVEEGITSLPQGTFSRMSVLRMVSMADSVTTLGSACFAYSTCLTSVELSNNITSIPFNCFKGCNSLKSITLPENISYIGEDSFYCCTNITDIYIGDLVTTIDDGAFYNCRKLKKVTIGSQVKTIGDQAFDDCPIEELYYNGTIKNWMGISFARNGMMEKGAVYMKEDGEYKLLEHLTIPSNVLKITANSLRGCSSIKSIKIPDTVTLVEYAAFNSCDNLETVEIDGAVKVEDAFSYCDSLRDFIMTGDVVNATGLSFSGCTSLENVFISDNIELGSYIFYGCTGLKEFVVPKCMTQIGDSMFFECTNLEDVYMSKNITSIGEDAFDGCRKLKNIFYDGTEEEWNDISVNRYGNTYLKNATVHYNSVGHNWNNEYTVDKEATCTEEGYKSIHCGVCDATKDVTTIPVIDHTYGDWIVDENATCTEEGHKHKACACGNTVTETISATGHKEITVIGKEATCTQTGLTDGKWCEVCETTTVEQEVIKKKSHNYSTAYTIDKKATTSEAGSKSRHCKVTDCTAKTAVTSIPKISTVTLSATKYTYSGSAKKPTVTVKDSKGNKLVNGTDYTVSYASGRTKVGRYKVTITYKGNYSGSKVLYFTIVPKAPSTVTTTLYGYDDIKVSWSKCTGASGYAVYYKKSTSSSYSLLTRTTGTSAKAANLTDGIQYNFKIVPYYKSGDTRYESTQSKTSSIYTLKQVATPKVTKSGTKVKVSWKNISGETGYQISKSTSKTGTNIVSTYATTSGTYKTISATKGKTYYYKVRAYKTVNGTKIYGPWSSVVKYKR